MGNQTNKVLDLKLNEKHRDFREISAFEIKGNAEVSVVYEKTNQLAM